MIQSETRSVWLIFFLGSCCVTTVLGRDETATYFIINRVDTGCCFGHVRYQLIKGVLYSIYEKYKTDDSFLLVVCRVPVLRICSCCVISCQDSTAHRPVLL